MRAGGEIYYPHSIISKVKQDLALFHEGQKSSEPLARARCVRAVHKRNKCSLPPQRALCAQEGLANVIVTACRVRANDETNSRLKRLAEFLSPVFSRTKSATTFDVPPWCCAARLAFCLLIPLSRCLLGVESEETRSSIPVISRGKKQSGGAAVQKQSPAR